MTPWRRYRALELLARAWPELDADEPPERAVLAGLLERSLASGWTLASQREVTDSYEAVVVTGRIPTRDRSWHDVFNVLAFVSFPQTKAALHQRCFELQRARERKPPRSREEDALTLIDEASLLLAGSPEAIATFEQARADRNLPALDRIVADHGIHAWVLGHALLEHLALDRPRIGAGLITVALDEAPSRAAVDRVLAERIAAGGFPIPRMSPTLPWPHPTVDGWLVDM